MIVTKIKRKGKSDEYYVSFDNNSTLLVKYETIYKNQIKDLSEITQNELEQIFFEDQKLMAFDKSLTYISKGLKTEKEIRTNLKNKGFIDSAISYAINMLKEYKYVDDEKYANLYIETYKNSKGKLLLKQKLIEKGVKLNIIENALLNMENNDENVILLAKKYMNNKIYDEKNKVKLYRFLQSKGFTFDEIKKAVDKVFKGENCENWE